MKPRPWTESELQRARELHAAGTHPAGIGRALGRSEAAVRLKLTGLGFVSGQSLRQKEMRR
jgi:hypothetical protein